jgi:hypothetical protein
MARVKRALVGEWPAIQRNDFGPSIRAEKSVEPSFSPSASRFHRARRSTPASLSLSLSTRPTESETTPLHMLSALSARKKLGAASATVDNGRLAWLEASGTRKRDVPVSLRPPGRERRVRTPQIPGQGRRHGFRRNAASSYLFSVVFARVGAAPHARHGLAPTSPQATGGRVDENMRRGQPRRIGGQGACASSGEVQPAMSLDY